MKCIHGAYAKIPAGIWLDLGGEATAVIDKAPFRSMHYDAAVELNCRTFFMLSSGFTALSDEWRAT